MKRITATMLVFGLVLAACAADDGDQATDPDSAEVGGGTVSEGENGDGGAPGDSGLPVNEGEEPPNDSATSGLAEPGDPPPPADDSDSLVLGDGVPDAVIFALQDLAARLGMSADLIDWVSHEEVDWPDASVGCPHPDMAYAQVITNGTLTVFEVDGIEYHYHARAGLDPFYCDPAIADKSAPGFVDQIDLSDFIVPSEPPAGDESVPTESVPPPSGSDE